MSLVISETRDIATCLRLRRIVFIEEQNVPEAEELDGLDAQSVHLLAELEGRAIGSARLMRLKETGKIGRVCVLKEARGTGAGAALIRHALGYFRTVPGVTRVKLGAQTHALAFYERLGFSAFGPEYMDAGIPHQDMEIRL